MNEEALENLLKRAIVAVIKIAKKQNVGPDFPSYDYTLEWFEPTGATTGKYESAARTEKSYLLFNHEYMDDIQSDSDVQKFNNMAQKFVKEKGLLFVTSFPNRADPIFSTLLGEYFHRKGTLELDEQIVQEFCSEFIQEWQAETGIKSAVYIVSGFSALASFNLSDNIEFRPMTMGDVDEYGRDISGMDVLDRNHWICEIEQCVSKVNTIELNRFTELGVNNVLSALSLATSGQAGFLLLRSQMKCPFLRNSRASGLSKRYAFTSKHGGRIELDDNSVDEFKRFYKIINKPMEFKYLELPLRKLRDSASRQNIEDPLIDCVVALERLLAPDSPNPEITFRFSLRGAALLPDSYGTPEDKINLMKNLYNMRSKVIHGNAPKNDEIRKFSEKSEKVLKDIIKWYFAHGAKFRSHKDVVKMIDESFVANCFVNSDC